MVEVKIDAAALTNELGVIDERLQKRGKALVRNVLVDFEEKLTREQFKGYRGKPYRNALQRRNGDLVKSIRTSRIKELRGGGARGSTFTTSRYAPIHEFGGTIRPKRAKFLRVPLSSTLTPSGVAREENDIREVGGRWQTKDGRPTFIHKGGIFAEGLDGQPKLLYSLRRSVTIKPRLRWFDTWDSLEAKRSLRIRSAVQFALGVTRG